MGYTFTIGNATPRHSKEDFPYLSAEWDVDVTTHPDAPVFPNDEMTGNTNQRSPSYSVWAEFCRKAGLYDVLMNERGSPIGGHPGCAGLTLEIADRITEARKRLEAKATLPPGFEGWNSEDESPPRYDYTLARLIWLDWWVRWAVENCETPAMANS